MYQYYRSDNIEILYNMQNHAMHSIYDWGITPYISRYLQFIHDRSIIDMAYDVSLVFIAKSEEAR